MRALRRPLHAARAGPVLRVPWAETYLLLRHLQRRPDEDAPGQPGATSGIGRSLADEASGRSTGCEAGACKSPHESSGRGGAGPARVKAWSLQPAILTGAPYDPHRTGGLGHARQQRPAWTAAAAPVVWDVPTACMQHAQTVSWATTVVVAACSVGLLLVIAFGS